MSKLIYVDKLKKDILALRDCYNGFSDTYDKACIIGVIDEQPTIEERKTGRWIVKPVFDGDLQWWELECSTCGEKYCLPKDGNMPHYCPNCGTKN